MRNQITIIFLLIIFSNCTSSKDCSNFKVGKFKYSDPEYSEWSITRTNSTQTEISNKSGIEIYSSIEWLSDCEYVLTYRRVLNSNLNNLIGKKIEVEILNTTENSYICKSKSDAIDLKIEMVKID